MQLKANEHQKTKSVMKASIMKTRLDILDNDAQAALILFLHGPLDAKVYNPLSVQRTGVSVGGRNESR
jgi:hypothetical protein